MTQQYIDTGNTANDGTGTPLRDAFDICNSNFTELYGIGGVTGIQNGNSNVQVITNSTVNISSRGVANVFVVSGTGATLTGLFTGNGIISAVGNVVTGGTFIGDGSALTGVVSSPAASLITGSTLSSNVTTSSLTTVGSLGSLTVTANVQGGNLRTAGQITSTGNVTGGNLIATSAIIATGNASGGNLTTGGQVSATGNITSAANVAAAYFVGNGSALTGVVATTSAALLTGATFGPLRRTTFDAATGVPVAVCQATRSF